MNFKLIEMTVLADTTPWYMQLWFVALAWMAAMALCMVVSSFLAKKFRLPDYWWKMATILCATVSAGFIIGQSWPPKFGVDLRGGVSIIGELEAVVTDANGNEITIRDLIPALKERIDPSGTKEITLTPMSKDKLEVIIPDADLAEAKRVWARLASAGNLLFRIVVSESKDSRAYTLGTEQASKLQEYVREPATDDDPEGKIVAKWFRIKRAAKQGEENPNPPFKFIPGPSHLVRNRDTGELVDMASVPLPQTNDEDVAGQALADWTEQNQINDLEVLMLHPDERFNVEGRFVSRAAESMDEKGQPAVDFFLKGDGIRRMHRMTTTYMNRQMGIILDGQLLSAPTISGEISSRGQIYGLSKIEAQDLVTVLNAGKLDVALKDNWISMDLVLSNLGQEMRTNGVTAIGISFALVFIFMIIYYRFAGIVACFALVLNLVLMMALIIAIKLPISLTGLAGIVLTVGMSVDANVLIFERIREELNRGAKLRMAIRNGFDRATTTIVDANITTLITALVLYMMGTEQLKSFSATLIIGILMSMFTAIFCSRVIFEISERQRWISALSMTNLIGQKNWDFIGKRNVAFLASILVIVVGIVAIGYRGGGILDYDLRGGQTARVLFQDAQKADDLRNELENKFTYEGEPIVFEVTPIAQFQNADGQLVDAKDRYFKINCSLRVWDGETGKEPDDYRTIEQMIKEAFMGKLVMYNLQYDASKMKIEEAEASGSGNASIQNKPPIRNVSLKPGQYASSGFRAIPAVIQEENNQDENQGQENNSGDAGSGDQDSGAANQQDESAGGGDGTAPGVQDGGAQDGNAGNQESGENQEGGANQGGPDEKLYNVTVQLQFERAVDEDNLKSQIEAASQALPNARALLDRDIELKAVDAASGTTSAKTWDVTIKNSNEQLAGAVFAKTQEMVNAEPFLPSTSGVGGQIAGAMQQQAAAAMLASLIGIVAYVWFRFQNVAFGLAAVVALIHDVLVVLGAIAVSYFLQGGLGFLLIDNFKISLPVVAAFLTIIGYSLNDTIVVFDRIREVRGKRTELTSEMINTSISQTLGRTLLTSLTTFIVVIILFAMGGEAIHGFAFALVVGVIVGTYSSIFVASPVLLWLMNRANKGGGIKADSGEVVA